MTKHDEASLARKGNMSNLGFAENPKYKKEAVCGKPLVNEEDWRRGELFSCNCSANARGLAKLGGYMANKGEL